MKMLPYDLVDSLREASREPCLDFRRRPGRGTTSGRPSAEPRPGALSGAWPVHTEARRVPPERHWLC